MKKDVTPGGVTDFRSRALSADESLGSVSNVLWELRELLDMTCYLLTVERLLATAGEAHYLNYAAQQLDVLTEQIRRTEIMRTAATEHAAELLRLHPGASLAELAAAAPSPWDEILAEHRDGLRALSDKVAAGRGSTEQALRAGSEAVRNALRAVDNPPNVLPLPPRLDYRA